MPFLAAARRRVAALPPTDPEHVVLAFLLAHAIGRARAQPWRVLSAHLTRRGIHLSQQAFQQGILKATRENDIFIASNDHGRCRGYFLIQDPTDAAVMRDWYRNRIRAEAARLRNLRRHARGAHWPI